MATVIGTFESTTDAQSAVNELRSLGFNESQIGVASKDGCVTKDCEAEDMADNAAKGATVGTGLGLGAGALWGLGIAAGLLPAIGPVIAGGTLAAIAASAATGAAACGVAGALIGMGVPDEDAEYYENEFRAGRVIVSVKSDSRMAEAEAVLRKFGALRDTQRVSV